VYFLAGRLKRAAVNRVLEWAELSDEMELLAVMQQEISARLRPICGLLPESDFEKLVREIATVKLKYGEEAELSAAFRERLTMALQDRPNKATGAFKSDRLTLSES